MKIGLTVILKTFVAALCGIALVPAAHAQFGLGLPRRQPQILDQPPFVAPLTQRASAEQITALEGGGRFRPGIYLIRPLNAQLCLEQFQAGGLERPYMRLANCDINNVSQQFALIPSYANKVTIRTIASANDMNRLTICATVARGVVFGPPRIDLLGCDFGPGNQSWHYVGNRDQKMELHWSAAKSAHEIKTDDGYGSIRCWAMRGAGGGINTDVIQWDCNGQDDQFFNLVFLRAFGSNIEAETLGAYNWIQTPDGPRKRPQVGGMDIVGGDYTVFETINDNGEYCSMRCVESPECKAYTWKSANYYVDLTSSQPPAKPMCELKSAVVKVFFRGQAKVGLIKSGIVRP